MTNLRTASRALRKQPGASVVVVLTLAVAIAAASVIYSAIDVVQHFIPIQKRERLVYATSVATGVMQRGSNGQSIQMRSPVSIPDLADWSSRNATFDQMAAFAIGSANLTGVDVPMRVTAIRVTANLPELWGLMPTAGRSFLPAEGRPGSDRAALLSQRFWEQQFSSNMGAIGQTLMLDRVPHTIVGILPPAAGSGLFRDADVFLPLVVDGLRGARDDRTVIVTGRLKPAVTLDQAAADLGTIARQLEIEHPATNKGIGAVALPIVEVSGFNVRILLAILGLIALLLLAVAFANLANVVIAQSIRRSHEFAVRTALGAGRLDRVRQLMLENMLASLAAGVIGVMLAFWAVAGLRWLGGDTLGLADVRINGRVLLAGLVTAVLAPFGFALWPALRMPAAAAQALADGGRTVGAAPQRRRTRALIVMLQTGAAVVLMLQIAMMVRTTWTLSRTEAGFDPTQVLTLHVGLSGDRYADPAAIRRFSEATLSELRALPGVAFVGSIDRLPIADNESMARLAVEGDTPAARDAGPQVAHARVDGSYLSVMRIPLRSGRAFSDDELMSGAPVALVNDAAVRRFWPGRTAIGTRIALDAPFGRESWLTVIGVVGNTRNSDADQGPLPEIYTPASRSPDTQMAFVVRSTSPDPLQLVPSIRARIAKVDAEQPIFDVATMSRILYDDLAGTYVLASLLAAIGLVALGLSAAGIYGVVSQSVAQRSREIGVRMAFGASPRAMIRMMVADGLRPVVIGGGAGLLLAVALAFVMATAVPELDVRDPVTYAGVILAIAVVAGLASYVPARSAASVDPLVSLRSE